MPSIIVRPDLGQQAYRVLFHVRTPARCSADEHEQRRNRALETMIPQLSKQGWRFKSLLGERPRGPLPVVPVKGVGKRPARLKRQPGRSSPAEPPDDALWRVSTLPQFGPHSAHLMTDEVEWEYAALFEHATLVTEKEKTADA
jgi:hypothetical protein